MIHLPLPIVGQLLEHRRPALGIVARDDLARRLVVDEHARRGSVKRIFTSSPLMRTSSPGPTFCPISAGSRLTVMRPARIISSIARREPKPHEARTLCRRCGSLKTSSVERLCLSERRFSRIALQRQVRLLHRAGARSGLARASAASAALVGASGISRRWEESSSASGGSSAREREAEVVEEGLGRRVERRASRRLAMADGLDPLPVLERLDDVRGHGDAADRLRCRRG